VKRIHPVVIVVLLPAVAIAADKSIPELIRDLGVEDAGNHTCNTACGILVKMKDEAVPHLQGALQHPNTRVRYYAVRCLGNIDTAESRRVLLDALSTGTDDVREHAAYALTWHPHPDAEQAYIYSLSGENRGHVLYAIRALGEIKSRRALPDLTAIRDDPESWRFYYAAIVAIRKIESKELTQEVVDALNLLRKAKYCTAVGEKQLSESVAVIKANLDRALPDVFDIFLWRIKGRELKIEPNAATILRDAGTAAHPYIRIALKDDDQGTRRRTRALIKKLRLEDQFKEGV
jgi:HEAT repeat protein